MGRRRNLEVRPHAHATRVVFERAGRGGVEYLCGGERQVARARREVLVSAGAVNSPQLLELSGIGEGARLSARDPGDRRCRPWAGTPGPSRGVVLLPLAGADAERPARAVSARYARGSVIR